MVSKRPMKFWAAYAAVLPNRGIMGSLSMILQAFPLPKTHCGFQDPKVLSSELSPAGD